MDAETSKRPDPMAATALQREIEAAVKRIENGLAQASAGIASLQGPLLVMANLLLVTREGKPASGDEELPEAEETVPEDQRRLRIKEIFKGGPQGQRSETEERGRDLEEQEPPAAEETVPEDQRRLKIREVFGGGPLGQRSGTEERGHDPEEQEPPAAEEAAHSKEDQFESGVALDNAAKERLSKIEERLRSLED